MWREHGTFCANGIYSENITQRHVPAYSWSQRHTWFQKPEVSTWRKEDHMGTSILKSKLSQKYVNVTFHRQLRANSNILVLLNVRNILKTSFSAGANNSNQTKLDWIKDAHVYCSAPGWPGEQGRREKERRGWGGRRWGGPHQTRRPRVPSLGSSLNSRWEWYWPSLGSALGWLFQKRNLDQGNSQGKVLPKMDTRYYIKY